MTRGKQKIEAQKKAQEKAHSASKKGSQLEHRAAAFKLQCALCKAMLSHQNQVLPHFDSKHPGQPHQLNEI